MDYEAEVRAIYGRWGRRYDEVGRDLVALIQRAVAEEQAKVEQLSEVIAAGYNYDPGDSDLDDERPISVRMTLGDYRLATQWAAIRQRSKP